MTRKSKGKYWIASFIKTKRCAQLGAHKNRQSLWHSVDFVSNIHIWFFSLQINNTKNMQLSFLFYPLPLSLRKVHFFKKKKRRKGTEKENKRVLCNFFLYNPYTRSFFCLRWAKESKRVRGNGLITQVRVSKMQSEEVIDEKLTYDVHASPKWALNWMSSRFSVPEFLLHSFVYFSAAQ